ncbi:MAG: manganese efflux pump MntP [Steroidobacteraceae bacterium]
MLLKVAAFVVPLAFDSMMVAVLLGLRGVRPLRPAVTFALFEGVMPLFGISLGRVIGAYYERLAGVLGGVVLVALAIHVLKEALEDEDESAGLSFASIRTSALAGFAISVDEAAIGFPLGASRLPIPLTIAAIAAQAFLVTYAGTLVGARLGARIGEGAGRLAGLFASAAFGLLGAYLIAQTFVSSLPRL